MDAWDRVAESIEEAKADLDRALAELQRVPGVDATAVGYVAHALNNYLTLTTVTVELLQAALRDNPNPEVRTWLDGLLHVTDLMSHTVGKLLHASGNDFPLKIEIVNLFVLMTRVCNHYGRLASRKQIRVNCRGVGEIPLVKADRVATVVVADNLLSNAVKFSKPGTVIQVQLMSEPGWVVCSVRDEGPGISAEDQTRLFQKGVTLSAVPTGGEPTAGYGLALAWDFVDKMHGKLWCESELGRGARFSFRLPSHE
jgi:signal transduction histidine kinase